MSETQPKISVISTVLNEAEGISVFLDQLLSQSLNPKEIVIVDGGSTDGTAAILREYEEQNDRLHVIEKEGNRSVGRNAAIRAATGDIIAVADAGGILDKNWFERLVKPIVEGKADLVAGYHKPYSEKLLGKLAGALTYTPIDKADPQTFGSMRSRAFRREVWEKAGGFPELFAHNEDTPFILTVWRQKNLRRAFAPDSVVLWRCPETLRSVWRTYYRYALGDAEGAILRKAYAKKYLEYVLYGALSVCAFFWIWSLAALFPLLALKLGNAVRNTRRSKLNPFFIPALILLRVYCDGAMLIGYFAGSIKRMANPEFRKYYAGVPVGYIEPE